MLAIPVSDRLLALGFSRFDSNYHPFASRPLGPGEVQEQEVCRSARRVWVSPTPQGLPSDVADSLLVSSRSWSPQPRGRSREYLRSQLPPHPDPRKFQHSEYTVPRACRRDRSRVILPRGEASHGSSCPRALPGFVRRRFFRIGRPEFGLFRSGSFSLRSGWSGTASLSFLPGCAGRLHWPCGREFGEIQIFRSSPLVPPSFLSFRTTV